MSFFVKTFCKNDVTFAKRLVPFLVVFSTVLLSFITVFANVSSVTIADGEETIVVRTMKELPEEILEENNISVSDSDIIKTTSNEKGMVITISRAVPVNLVIMGESKTILSAEKTVGDVLSSQGIEILEGDTIIPSVYNGIYSNIKITLSRTVVERVTETQVIPCTTEKIYTSEIPEGQVQVIKQGKDGKKEVTYEITTKDGVEVSRKLISSKTIERPVNGVSKIGERINVIETSRSEVLRYSKVLTVTATAYDLSYQSTGKTPSSPGYGITATGMKARRGVIAVDPKVIPLYSRLYIESPDGSWCYGYAVAGDTGGAIKGNKIDLFFPSHSEAINFGRRTAKVYILE